MRIDGYGAGATALDRIVAIRPGALGDALLLFPTLALVRRAFVDSRVTLVARPDVLPLARTSGFADETSSYDDPSWAALFAERPRDDSPARELLADATTLAWLVDSDGNVAHNLKALGAAQAFTLPPLPPPSGPREHMALHLARALEPLGIGAPATTIALISVMPPLAPPDEDERQAEALWKRLGLSDSSTGIVALHSGSGGVSKRWPPERFAELVSSIRQMGFSPLLLEGPQDTEVTSIIAERAEGTLPIARNLTAGTLAALLRRCTAYVGNDSGVTHLAGMLGVRTLALFGPTDPALWAPLGPHVRITQAKDGRMESLSTLEVQEALAALLHA
jgi:heptosyltransferase-3